MARPRKIATELMIEIVDSYYLTRSDGNEKLMKCSLIAEYAAELGYCVEGYDLRRNLEVREHIERLKVCAETCKEVYGKKYIPSAYKGLDIDGLLQSNSSNISLAEALRQLDAYWRRVYEYSEQATKQNRLLVGGKAELEASIRGLSTQVDGLTAEISEISSKNSSLVKENRYLRKMLRTYLYPAVADEILRRENEPLQTETKITEPAIRDFIETRPKSFEASVTVDNKVQSESERLIKKLWEKCDE